MLRCAGEEDRATQGARRAAFVRAIKADHDVVADLSQLSFADSSLVLDLAALARRLRARERTLRLRDAQPQVLKLIEITGIHKLPGIKLELRRPILA